MQFGYFDDRAKEYVITRPDTPRSWTNHLGSTRYGGVISNNAGGYGFFRSASLGRFLRFFTNGIPMDQPGRYLYLRDPASGDYWSASWQPVGKPLEQYKSVCRHGTGYTVITSQYAAIETETTYFVPLGKDFECWLVRVTNRDARPRSLRLFTYVEYPSTWHMINDWINLQYTHCIVKMDCVDNIIDHGCNVGALPVPGDPMARDQRRHTFLALLGAEVTGFDTDRDVFIGDYRHYGNPIVVERGQCTGSLAAGDNGCGTLQADLELEPGQTREIVVLLGIGMAAVEGKQTAAQFGTADKVRGELDRLKRFWHDRLGGISVETPDAELNSMLNVWSPYNCLITFDWSRAASFIYTAYQRDGLAYRDTVQDFLGVCHLIPHETRDRLELMITGQAATGGAMPLVQPLAHRPGQEKPPQESEYRADDCQWLFNAVDAYVKESGDLGFYDKLLPYADQGQDTVLGHLRRAIEFNFDRCGAHGLPSGLYADWNDCLRFGPKGESIFVALQLRFALAKYIEVCKLFRKPDQAQWAAQRLDDLDRRLEKHAWDGQWYLRGYGDDGQKYGSHENAQGAMYLNPQSWAVISGHAAAPRAEAIMAAVQQRLATEYGIMLCDPPYEDLLVGVVRSVLFNKGMKENAGIFSHVQGWAIMAEAMLGHGDTAYRYFRAYLPAAYNTRAEIRQIEPYVYCQSTHSRYSPRYGASRLPWLSGSAAWSYYAATQYILGIQPDYFGLRIDPCIPASWPGFRVKRRFRGKDFDIRVENPSGVQKGVKRLVVNGRPAEGNLVPVDRFEDSNEILVEMG
jgi:cellobiose phosphorylase